MKRLLISVAALAALVPATAHAQPAICTPQGVTEVLAASDEDAGAGINQIRCADVTGDGAKDSVFTVLSGGTAGPTQFGVITGGGEVDLELLQDGYKLSVDTVNKTRFDVQQPVYKKQDANCCPSSYRFTPYRWNGSEFQAGKDKTYKKAKKRFFKGAVGS